MSRALTFAVHRGADLERRVRLERSIIEIGRDERAQIALDQGLQSRDRGRYRHTFEACPESETATWGSLEWDARVPAGSHLTFTARTGDDPAALEPPGGLPIASIGTDEPPVDVGSALDAAGLPHGHLLELWLDLVSDDGENAPTVLSFSVAHSCVGLLE